jgi:hypothetical protein
MDYSSLRASLLTSPDAAPLLPLLQKVLTHCQHFADRIGSFRNGTINPSATHHFEGQLQQGLRQLGLDLCHWTFKPPRARRPPTTAPTP